jgi:tetratricopeptide (TPR) repeat protein
MTRLLTKSPFVLAFGFWIFAFTATFADGADLNALNQQVYQLIAQGKYQEAIPIAERAVELAKQAYGPERMGMAQSLNNLAMVYQDMGEYAKA